jgi:type IV secretion system protein VirB10
MPATFAIPALAPRSAMPVDKALIAPIFAYGTANGASATAPAPAAAPGHQTPPPKIALSRALMPSDRGAAARAKLMPHPDLTIPAGTINAYALQTAINSQLMGFVDCVLPQAVRGATLLDRGTQIIGEIRSGLLLGQDRLFILWTRARTPENVVIALASPAADQLGRAGVSGAVDNHFLQRFGAAILFSVIGSGPQIASSALQHGNGNNYLQLVAPQQQVANTILEQTLQIPPTLEKNQGDNVSIFVARDLDFSGVYDLRSVTR